jgi:anti-anti-sigma factor
VARQGGRGRLDQELVVTDFDYGVNRRLCPVPAQYRGPMPGTAVAPAPKVRAATKTLSEAGCTGAGYRHPAPLTVTVERRARSLIVRLAGEVDLGTAPGLRLALERAVDERPRVVVVDLSKVAFLGCAGLSQLVSARQRAGRRTCLRVVATSRVTRRPLRLTGLDQYLGVFDSLAAALTNPVGTEPGA